MPQTVAYSRRLTSRTIPNEGVYAFWSCNSRDELSRIRNIGMGGLFLETPVPKPLGAAVKLYFLVSEGQVRTDALVCHVKPKEGLGLKFTALNDQDRQRFAALMKRLRN